MDSYHTDKPRSAQLALEVATHDLDLIEEIACFSKKHVQRLQDRFTDGGRCVVSAHPLWRNGGPWGYEVVVRLYSFHHYVDTQCVEQELARAIRQAFDDIESKLELPPGECDCDCRMMNIDPAKYGTSHATSLEACRTCGRKLQPA